MYDIYQVADEFLNMDSMTPKKLQKLCYYAQGWCLGISNEKLFKEDLEAWIHGPVSPLLYDKYKIYGYLNIPQNSKASDDKELRGIVEQIYRIYGHLSGDQLEQMTHSEEPWLNARKNLEPWEPSNEIIKIEDMRKYFSQKYHVKEA